VKELVALAKAKPGALNYGTSTPGGPGSLGAALLKSMTGINIVNVPYKGGPQALTDLVSGQVQVMFGTAAITLSQVRSGRLKALGVSSARRSSLLPEVPTIAESGAPGYEMSIWWGVIAPVGLPAAIVTRLNTEIGQILGQPESAQRLAADGAVPSASGSAEFGRMLIAEVEKWRRVAREADIKAE